MEILEITIEQLSGPHQDRKQRINAVARIRVKGMILRVASGGANGTHNDIEKNIVEEFAVLYELLRPIGFTSEAVAEKIIQSLKGNEARASVEHFLADNHGLSDKWRVYC